MKVCLHCGYEILEDGLRTCPRCGQLLPAEETAVARSQYISGDLLREQSGAASVHPYLWGVESAEHEVVQPSQRGRVSPALLVLGLAVLLVAAALVVLYATGNASWLPGGQ